MKNIPHVLIVPFAGQGHVYPMMNLSQKLAEQGCKITFVTLEFIHKRMISSMSQQESLDGSLIKLVSIPDGLAPEDGRTDVGELCVFILRTMPSMLEKLIEDIHVNGDDKITCIVADAGMGWTLEVGRKFGVKGVLYWPASATTFAVQYNIPKLIKDGIIDSEGFPIKTGSFQISSNMPTMDTEVIWWSKFNDRAEAMKTFNYMMHCMHYLNLTEWWICNTTYELEPGPISCLPKVIPVGPLLRSCHNTNITTKSLGQLWEEDLSCMNWLDEQPPHSVTYVAFGSTTFFDQNQFNELALALDLANRPFLWVVRQDNMKLPDQFLGSKGKIVGWTPQQKVLSHHAMACFVSHCGWNSTIEGLSNGVPFLCWPNLQVDQISNKSYICNELKVGMGLNPDENGHVSRWEIKKKLDQLISDEQIRTRCLEVKEKVMNSIAEGGESSKNIRRLVNWLKS